MKMAPREGLSDWQGGFGTTSLFQEDDEKERRLAADGRPLSLVKMN
jgi:hypothetical protein